MSYHFRLPDQSSALAVYAMCRAGLVSGTVERDRTDTTLQFVFTTDTNEDVPSWIARMGAATVLQSEPVAAAELIEPLAVRNADHSWGSSAVVLFPTEESLFESVRRHLSAHAMDIRIGTIDSGCVLFVGDPRVGITDTEPHPEARLFWQAQDGNGFWYVEQELNCSFESLPREAVGAVFGSAPGHMLIRKGDEPLWIAPEWLSLIDFLCLVPQGVGNSVARPDWQLEVPLTLRPVRHPAAPRLWEITDRDTLEFRIARMHDLSLWDSFSLWDTDSGFFIMRHGETPVVDVESLFNECSRSYSLYGDGNLLPTGMTFQPLVSPEDLSKILDRPDLFGNDTYRVFSSHEDGPVTIRTLRYRDARRFDAVIRLRLEETIQPLWRDHADAGLEEWKRELPLVIPVTEKISSGRSAVRSDGRQPVEEPPSSPAPKTDSQEENVPAIAAKTEEAPEPEGIPATAVKENLFENVLSRWEDLSDGEREERVSALSGAMGIEDQSFDDGMWMELAAHYFHTGETKRGAAVWAQWVLKRKPDDWEAALRMHPYVQDLLGAESSTTNKTPGFLETRLYLDSTSASAEIVYLLLSARALQEGNADAFRGIQQKVIRGEYSRESGHEFTAVSLNREGSAERRQAQRQLADPVEIWGEFLSGPADRFRASFSSQLKLIADIHGVHTDAERYVREPIDVSLLGGGASAEEIADLLERGAGSFPADAPSEKAVREWWKTISGSPFRYSDGGHLTLAAVLDEVPNRSALEKAYSQIISRIDGGGSVTWETIFLNELGKNPIKDVVDTRTFVDIIDDIGPADIFKNLIPPYTDPDRSDIPALAVQRNGLSFYLNRLYGKVEKNSDGVGFLKNNAAALMNLRNRAERKTLNLLGGVIITLQGLLSPDLLVWMAQEAVTGLAKEETEDALVFLHRFVAMCQVGSLYTMESEKAGRSLFEVHRRAEWTGTAARLLQADIKDIV